MKPYIAATTVLSVIAILGNAAPAQVNIDIGGVHVQVGDTPKPPAGCEVLTRGPIHEAFAEPVVFSGESDFIVTRRPPAPIGEIPPAEKPEGKHVAWIPGYWNWSDDQNDFIWVSGCWRLIPPHRSWVPGYWAEVQGGFQWIPGFWGPAGAEEIQYLPTPPATLEQGPVGAAPSADSIWIPGCWIWQTNRYAWRPGFYEPAREKWVWSPAYYVYSPQGCIFVDGYWDFPLERRGVAFLPMVCPASVYSQPGYTCTPDIAIDLSDLTQNLFCWPRRHHYYFGDYYDAAFAREGIIPWYQVRDRHDLYDPIYVHQRWSHRDDPKWNENLQAEFEHRRDDKNARPARTYEALQAQTAKLPEKQRNEAQFAKPLKEVAASKASPLQYETLSEKTRQETATQGKQVHEYKTQRTQWESPTGAAKTVIPVVTPKEVIPPKETVVTPPTPPREITTPHETKVTPPPPAPPREFTAHTVKVPSSPVTVQGEHPLQPPPRPEMPRIDTTVRPPPPPPPQPSREPEERKK